MQDIEKVAPEWACEKGQKVVIVFNSSSTRAPRVRPATVERVTKTLVVVKDNKGEDWQFRKAWSSTTTTLEAPRTGDVWSPRTRQLIALGDPRIAVWQAKEEVETAERKARDVADVFNARPNTENAEASIAALKDYLKAKEEFATITDTPKEN